MLQPTPDLSCHGRCISFRHARDWLIRSAPPSAAPPRRSDTSPLSLALPEGAGRTNRRVSLLAGEPSPVHPRPQISPQTAPEPRLNQIDRLFDAQSAVYFNRRGGGGGGGGGAPGGTGGCPTRHRTPVDLRGRLSGPIVAARTVVISGGRTVTHRPTTWPGTPISAADAQTDAGASLWPALYVFLIICGICNGPCCCA